MWSMISMLLIWMFVYNARHFKSWLSSLVTMTSELLFYICPLSSMPTTAIHQFSVQKPPSSFLHFRHRDTNFTNMSSLTGQESSETQPDNPVNPGNEKGNKVDDTSSKGLSRGTTDKVRATFAQVIILLLT